ncbi:MAG: TspO/MBR family protein [Candidatus Magasanikbacteria bacterium]
MKKKNKKILITTVQVLLCILIAQSAGIIGSAFTFSSIDSWYATLIKPSFNPPGYLFGPVWTFLYTLMGLSLFLLWKNKKKNKCLIIFFFVQLFFNALWSILFFGLQNPFLALIDILMLLSFIITIIIIAFKQKQKAVAYLFLPYLLWVSFATVLNWTLWMLNK